MWTAAYGGFALVTPDGNVRMTLDLVVRLGREVLADP